MEQQPEVKNCTQGAAPGQNRKCRQQLTLFERIMSFHNIFLKVCCEGEIQNEV